MPELTQLEVLNDVKATVEQVLADFTAAERALLDRHRARKDRALLALLLREILVAMLGRLLERSRGQLGTDFATIAADLAAKAIYLGVDINEEPS